MTKPAARLTDMHSCPMAEPGPKPHVGGPILGPGVNTVLIGNLAAAVVGDEVACAGVPDKIFSGSTTVLIGNKPAARMGDITVHGGTITKGFPRVLIGDGAGAASGQAAVFRAAAGSGLPFCPNCHENLTAADDEQEEPVQA